MKKLSTLAIVISLTLSAFAQSPEKMSYQCVVRNASGVLITSQSVGIRISILQGTTSGTVVYQETYSPNPQTNANGLVTVEIGSGIPVSGIFSNINWTTGPYFLRTETDPTGGTSYTIAGTSQLLSVPYALYAKTAENGSLWLRSDPNIYFNTGRVGIGTSSPATYIHGHGLPIAGRGQLSLSSPVGQDIFLSFYEENTFKAYLWYNVADQDLRLQNYTAGDLNLNPYGGNVGIGTNTPSSMLEVAGQAKIAGTLYMQNQNISNLANPINAQDAATKAYVLSVREIIYNELLLAGLNGVVFDHNGNGYKTIRIGSQVWMAQNLKTTEYNDGSSIPLTTDNATWASLSTPAYCWYNNDQVANGNTYGALYNWYTLNTGKLCPTGWHVPTDAEWTTLTTFLGGWGVAGDKLKEMGNIHWISSDLSCTNESGFTGLPGGVRKFDGTFASIGYNGCFWSSSEYSATGHWYRQLESGYSGIATSWFDNHSGLSVRCLRD